MKQKKDTLIKMKQEVGGVVWRGKGGEKEN